MSEWPAGLLLAASSVEKHLGSGISGFRLSIPEIRLVAGDRVALVGPSGAGKSTFLALLAMALRPDSCACLVARLGQTGTIVDAGLLWATRREGRLSALRSVAIGYVPQTAGLLPFLSLRRNIALTQQLARRPDPEFVEHLAERLGIANMLNRLPAEVSVGERQRAAVARALAHRPALVLADEPTASVHPSQADEILRLLLDTADAGSAVLISTHDIARAQGANFAILECLPVVGAAAASVVRKAAA